jgi:hypothetical protein
MALDRVRTHKAVGDALRSVGIEIGLLAQSVCVDLYGITVESIKSTDGTVNGIVVAASGTDVEYETIQYSFTDEATKED